MADVLWMTVIVRDSVVIVLVSFRVGDTPSVPNVLLCDGPESHRVEDVLWDAPFEGAVLLEAVQLVDGVNEGAICAVPVRGALGPPELAEVVRNIFQDDSDHEHS